MQIIGWTNIAPLLLEVMQHFHYYGSFILLFLALYAVLSAKNLLRKLLGLSLFQSAVILLYVSLGFVMGGRPPLLKSMTTEYVYHAPLPHVLMLTAIVVSIATLSVGLSLLIRIKRENKTLDTDLLQDN